LPRPRARSASRFTRGEYRWAIRRWLARTRTHHYDLTADVLQVVERRVILVFPALHLCHSIEIKRNAMALQSHRNVNWSVSRTSPLTKGGGGT